MDETYLLVAARYIEFNPVRAGLAENQWEYQWSSASAHFTEKDDDLVNVSPLLEIAGDWKDFLSEDISGQERDVLRQYERNGRPLGSEHFVQTVEKRLGRMLRPQKPGPKKRDG
jgi:putative transposase